MFLFNVASFVRLLSAFCGSFRCTRSTFALVVVLGCVFNNLSYSSLGSSSIALSASTNVSDVVLKANNIIVRHGKHLYLVAKGSRHEISADRYTVDVMRQCKPHHEFVTLTRDELNIFPPGPAVTSLWDHHANIQMLSYAGQSASFIVSNEKFLKNLNPSIVYYKPRSTLSMIVSWRITPDKFRVVLLTGFASDGKVHPISGSIEQDSLLLKKIDLLHSSIPFLEIPGEDPRLFHLVPDSNSNSNSGSAQEAKGSIYVVFCRRYRRAKPELQMAYFNLIIDDYQQGSFNTPFKLRYDDIIDTYFYIDGKKYDEKNWSPFQYDSKLMFIEAFSPLHRIVKPMLLNPKKSWVNDAVLVGETFIKSSISSAPTSASAQVAEALQTLQNLWPFGEIRGGTPAKLIHTNFGGEPTSVYLSFFHSSTDPYYPNCSASLLKTYVMGAYTFEAKPPFKVLQISKKPIVHPDMYTGAWTDLPISFYHIDYVVFPTEFILSPDKKHVHVIYGSQDNDSALLKVRLQGLLESMIKVGSLPTKDRFNTI